ncbi:hypothetical protein NDU88_001480 [Pleurodeles waltl]|uniref:Uncharacterized protein n=1 Tax=Pleurodeles waltl TaxID=8319 RepID=A0AAV7Q774_PLEWA|nr:hypothetical protein NDU88_001480 [Pleurodeles waltl]
MSATNQYWVPEVIQADGAADLLLQLVCWVHGSALCRPRQGVSESGRPSASLGRKWTILEEPSADLGRKWQILGAPSAGLGRKWQIMEEPSAGLGRQCQNLVTPSAGLGRKWTILEVADSGSAPCWPGQEVDDSGSALCWPEQEVDDSGRALCWPGQEVADHGSALCLPEEGGAASGGHHRASRSADTQLPLADLAEVRAEQRTVLGPGTAFGHQLLVCLSDSLYATLIAVPVPSVVRRGVSWQCRVQRRRETCWLSRVQTHSLGGWWKPKWLGEGAGRRECVHTGCTGSASWHRCPNPWLYLQSL